MSEVVIRVENLGKRYRIGERERYLALRDVLTRAISAPARLFGTQKAPPSSNGDHSHIWALKDISFDIRQGEVVGIIGRNGAGKSTLLKILARVTKPTRGFAEVRGRIGTLLEVGTGFHPELTGRENVFLSGAILGMSKSEIRRKFDEIVAFANVEKFIDTPVKRYSSGMHLRLAFAVAVHMETEILLVDEVLAVGDAQFQKKCFEKFRQVRTAGRTILFVSHNMAALRAVCQTGIVLDHGGVVDQGEINDIADNYLARTRFEESHLDQVETESFLVEEVLVTSVEGAVIKTFDDVEVTVRAIAKADIVDPGLYVGILTLDGHRIAALDFKDFQSVDSLPKGRAFELGFVIESLPLLAGRYELELHMKDMGHAKFEFVPRQFGFEVVESPVYGGRQIDSWFGQIGLRARAFSRPPFATLPND